MVDSTLFSQSNSKIKRLRIRKQLNGFLKKLVKDEIQTIFKRSKHGKRPCQKKIETNQQKVLSLNFTEQVLQATKWQNISFIDSLVDNRNYLYINMPHSHSHGNIRNHAYFP
jgi:hypothetical protein